MFTFGKNLFWILMAGLNLATQVVIAAPSENPRDAALLSEENEFHWQPLDQMPEARSNPAVIAYRDSIYVIGGQGVSGPTDSVWEFTPKNKEGERWQTLSNLTYRRMGHRAVLFNSKIFVFGGVGIEKNNLTYLQSVESYDFATKIWKKESSMSVPRARFGVALLNDEIYIVGGENSRSHVLSTMEAYRPATQTWEKKTNIPQACNRMATLVLDNTIYVLGGENAAGNALKSVWYYDGRAKNWKAGEPMQVARKNFSAVVFDDQIMALGGWKNKGKDRTYVDAVESFSPNNHRWTRLDPLAIPRDGLRAVAFEDAVLTFGGFSNKKFLATVEKGRWFARPETSDSPD
jgi:N-acetylneuraminic acid mutarotase